MNEDTRAAAEHIPSTTSVVMNDARSKNKKMTALIILIFILMLIGIVAAAVFFNLRRDHVSNISISLSRMTNYLTTGDAAEVFPTSAYDISERYTLQTALNTHERDFLTKANELTSDFFDDAKETDLKDSLEELIGYQNKYWQIIYTAGMSYLTDDDSFFEYYIDKGPEATRLQMGYEHDQFVSASLDEGTAIANAYMAYEEALLEMARLIKSAGCALDNNTGEACIKKIKMDASQLATFSKAVEQKIKADRAVDSVTKLLLMNCWEIKETLDNE